MCCKFRHVDIPYKAQQRRVESIDDFEKVVKIAIYAAQNRAQTGQMRRNSLNRQPPSYSRQPFPQNQSMQNHGPSSSSSPSVRPQPRSRSPLIKYELAPKRRMFSAPVPSKNATAQAPTSSTSIPINVNKIELAPFMRPLNLQQSSGKHIFFNGKRHNLIKFKPNQQKLILTHLTIECYRVLITK
jgi:hypothetical protein